VSSALHADCASCFALCCVALPFSASADFAHDKRAGQPCGHLRQDFGCGIHDRLREEGYRGCAVYDCFGAGQHVSQLTFEGRDWRARPETARQMFAVFAVVRQLNELRWYLTEALALPAGRPLAEHLAASLGETERLTLLDASALEQVDVAAHRAAANLLLRQASALARGSHRGRALPKDLVGANLRGADLRGVDLRGAHVVAADLTDADLRLADLTGADLRDARLSGANLSTALFLTGSQLASAVGDGSTRLPEGLPRPRHWP
jgi:uncharacterized protein YjbI with pentapeptide repeats